MPLRRKTCLTLLAVGALMPSATSASAQDRSSLVGDWLGTLNAGGQQLRLVFHVAENDEGGLSGTLDSVDQGALGIPVPEVTLTGTTVRMSIPAVGGGFEGELADDGQSIEGTWSQGGASLPLTVSRTEGDPPAPERPQEPEPPLPYRALDVSFENADAGVTLAGTLTLPEGAGPFPAVALVSGSGPQDRDETVFGHRPFLVLSDHLTRKGIAVLRYDDRGVGGSTGDFGSATSADFAGDAAAAVRYLTARPEVDGAAVGIVGHSEGGLVAPLVATASDDVDFIVLMAGPGLTGREILVLQGELISLASGTPRSLVEKNMEAQERLFTVVEQMDDDVQATAAMQEVFREFFASLSDSELADLGVPGDRDAYANQQIAQLVSPWFRYFLTYDPAETLRRVRVPVLAVNGEKDLQVPAEANLAAIEAALEAGGNPDVTVRELSGLNHLFQTSATGVPAEYATLTETMAPQAMDMIAGWILERARP